MIKNIIFATIIAITAPVCAQETTTIPTIGEMEGDFLVLNSQEYNGEKSLATTFICLPLKIII